MHDLISRQAAIDATEKSRRLNHHLDAKAASCHEYEHRHFIKILSELPPVQSETCKGCKHFDKWGFEIYHGYPSPCTRCKRIMEDNYEK